MTITVKDIDALLPQTQCGECGFAGCLPYAEALVAGTAPIDRCPPGGITTLKALANKLHQDVTPYLSTVDSKTRVPALAVIREAECIGCTKCIKACPVDAIIGSAKRMHAIITNECTGCGLCVAPCPVDCIELLPIEKATYQPDIARQRFQQKQIRSLREQHQQQQSYRDKRQLVNKSGSSDASLTTKQEYILQALARAQAKKIS